MRPSGKRVSMLLMCIVLIMSLVLAACDLGDDKSGDGDKSNGDIIGNEHGGYDPATGKYFVNMPEFTWNDKTEFRVLVYDNTTQDTYYSEEIGVDKYETTDQAIEDAVRERNNLVFEEYGVEVVAVYTDNVYTDVNNDVMTGSGDYDAAMPFLSDCARLAQSNALYDLADVRFNPYIDFSMPWWDQNATESLSINNRVYFTTGDISFMQKIVSIAVTFNKDMLEDHFPDIDLYQMVRDGKWTFDEMVRLSKEVTLDDDGTAGFSYRDTWGLSGGYGDAAMYYLASGERMVSKDANDIPTLAVGSEKSITVAQKVLEQLQLKDEWVIHVEHFANDVPNRWQTSLDIFGEGRALFRTSAFSAIKKLRDHEANFGVVPLPKYDEVQDSYYTPCQAGMAYGIVIPNSAPDPEFSAYMIEVMSCNAKNHIPEAYYDTVLKGRDMRDDDSEEMLDEYIFNNVVYDLGLIYNFGGSDNGVSSMFSSLMTNSSTDITSTLESRRGAIIDAIDEVVDKYQSS